MLLFVFGRHKRGTIVSNSKPVIPCCHSIVVRIFLVCILLAQLDLRLYLIASFLDTLIGPSFFTPRRPPLRTDSAKGTAEADDRVAPMEDQRGSECAK